MLRVSVFVAVTGQVFGKSFSIERNFNPTQAYQTFTDLLV